MKNIKTYLIAAVAVFALQSCQDALTENPVTFYSEDTVFSTEQGIETAVNGVYATLGNGNYYGTSWHTLLAPVSGKFYSSQAANRDATGLNTTSSNPNLTKMWEEMFQVINTANTVIRNLENAEVNLPNRESALGHAYFLRGVAYFDLVRLFGGVPLRGAPTSLDDIHLPRAAKSEVYDFLIADFEKAKAMMPAPGETINNRPGNLAASAYLAKVYMTRAGEENGDTELWRKAQEEIQPVLGTAYSLTPTYGELFVPDNENTEESIFELQYGHTGGQRNSDIVRVYTPSKSTPLPTFGRIRPNKETFDAHVEQYPDDPRIDVTFIYNEYEKFEGGIQKVYPEKQNGNQGFALIGKWLDPSYNGTTTTRNFPVLRYADVLLMAAEIENEINGPDAAYPFVNEVLTRARDTDGDGMSDTQSPADWSGMNQDIFRQRILKERQYELLSEGHAWFDTRRRGYQYFLNEVIEPHNSHPTFDPTTDFVYPVSVKNMLLPIPQAELSGNQEIDPGEQNPGY